MERILREPDFVEIEGLFRKSFPVFGLGSSALASSSSAAESSAVIGTTASLDSANSSETGQVVYFPVRHHSPACALHLRRTIEQYAPEIILIEGPSDSAQLLPYIADTASEAPFCIYYSFDDKEGKVSEEREKYRAYYPFLDYSPELLAIREAKQRTIPVQFIDLPYALRLINKIEKEEPDTQFYYNENKEYEVNRYTSMIASRAGCRSFSEFWENRYELGAESVSTEVFVRNVFYLGYFMRLATPPAEVSLQEDVQREVYMAAEIRKAMAENKRVLVVAGAFHIAGLMEEVALPRKQQPLKPCNPEHVASYLMPYTFKEADSKFGYAAGMPFPAFYQAVWEKVEKKQEKASKLVSGKPNKGKATSAKNKAVGSSSEEQLVSHVFGQENNPDDKPSVYESTVLDYIIKTARYVRKEQSISLPDEINAFNMARSLAVLRSKPTPGVYELLDGVKSCFVKGDINSTSTFEVDFLLRLLSGMGAGKVVANEFIPPVVLEFRALCNLHRLKTTTVERQEVTLDIIKNPAHYRKSRFLHQLQFLKTGFCTLQSGPDYVNQKDKNLVREKWVCRYSTQVETQLTDLSVYGTTLSHVCASIIEKDFKDSLTAEELGRLLISVQVMGVDGFYTQYEENIRQVIANEKNFINLCKLLSSLQYLSHIQQLMNGEVHPLIPQLLRIAFREAVNLIPVIKQANEDEEQAICEQMKNLYGFTFEPIVSAVTSATEAEIRLDAPAFLQAVEKVLDDSFSNSRVFGVCMAILYKEGRIEQQKFCTQISDYLVSSLLEPEQAASFICGLFLIARDVLFMDNRILGTIDRVIASVDNEKFLTILPNLRYAFTSFLPMELDRLGRIVAEHHQVSETKLSGSLVLSQEDVAQGMKLDTLAAEALKLWCIN